MPSPLSARQHGFVEEFLKDRNATQAAIRAGYSEVGASVQGVRLLANAKIASEIERRTNKLADKWEGMRDRIIQEHSYSAFLDPAKAYDADGKLLAIPDMPEEVRRAIAGMDISEIYSEGGAIGCVRKIKLNNKVSHLSELATLFGLKQENASLSVGLAIHIHVSSGSDNGQTGSD